MLFLILLFFGGASGSYSTILEMLIKSFVFSSVIGLFLMNILFHYKNLWVFIDNLQISRMKLRMFNLVAYLFTTIILSFLFANI